MNTQEDILFAVRAGLDGDVGVITLNRPQALNALTDKMIRSLNACLQIWAANDAIKAVVIKAAAGRAFCAGGDLRLLYQHCLKARKKLPLFFIRNINS